MEEGRRGSTLTRLSRGEKGAVEPAGMGTNGEGRGSDPPSPEIAPRSRKTLRSPSRSPCASQRTLPSPSKSPLPLSLAPCAAQRTFSRNRGACEKLLLSLSLAVRISANHPSENCRGEAKAPPLSLSLSISLNKTSDPLLLLLISVPFSSLVDMFKEKNGREPTEDEVKIWLEQIKGASGGGGGEGEGEEGKA